MKTALVTGGSRGIGAAIVRALCSAGFRTTFLYRQSDAAANDVAAETGATAVKCDVSDPASVRGACGEALRVLGHVDALVNNAAISSQRLFTDITDAEWREMLDTNLSGAFYVTRAILPSMISRKSGRIVNISSVWGQAGASCETHYSAAKAGLIGLTLALSKEVAPSGVTVNCVCPGVIETDMLKAFEEQTLNELRRDTPMGRLGTPKDVADCVAWLCGDGAGFVTGQVIGVNGGFGM